MDSVSFVERAAALHHRLVDLADEAIHNPYNTAMGYYWLEHAERLNALIEAKFDALALED